MKTSGEDKLCRITKFGLFAPRDFNRISCANCYKLLGYVMDKSQGQETTLMYNTTIDGYLTTGHRYANQTLDPIVDSDVERVRGTMTEILYDKWRECCRHAEMCCTNVMTSDHLSSPVKNGSCESIWDGWSCHPRTLAGTTSVVKCPGHIIENTCNTILEYASFICNSNGEWNRNQYGEWVDYGTCQKSLIPIKLRSVYVNIVTHSVSLFFLIFGLIIFFSYRQLKVNRITLHKNFFISLILHSVAQIIWESVIMMNNLTGSAKYVDENNFGCIFTNVLLNYTRASNYFWMLCESLYLHKLLVTVFKEDSSLLLFYLIGWGIPLINICVYCVISYLWYNHNCWTQNLYINYIFTIPNILTILLNFVFLINVIRVLYKKLTAANANEPHQYRRAVRATLILVPLFGLHLILSPIVLCDSTPGSQIINLMNRLVESLQGFVVAIVYCFLNSEVTNLLKRSIVESKPFKVLIYDSDGAGNMMQTATSELDYADPNADNGVNPLKRLKRSLLRNSYSPRGSAALSEFRMSLSAARYPDESRL